MRIFVSHSHDDRALAESWKILLGHLHPGIDVWYSSDPDPWGGVGPGRWRERIGRELAKADMIFAVLTPESAQKPWIFWECAWAMGRSERKHVIPILYGMHPEGLPGPLQDRQSYRGDERES